jgi:hypothetical protein
MNHVQKWGERRLETLRGCGIPSLEELDLTDDRLADILHAIAVDEDWKPFEQELMGTLVRVYDLPMHCVRIDTTTAKSYAEVSEEGLLQLGHEPRP